MQLPARTAVSAFIASAVPPLPFLAIALLVKADVTALQFAGVIWLISLGHVVVLGLPVFFWLWRTGSVNSWSLLAVGFVLGFVPAAIYSWPGPPITDHLLHWLTRFGGPGFMGVLGAFSARAFWSVWYRLGPNNSFKPNPPRSFKTPSGSSGGSA
jgi:hypothetical protein